MKNIKNILYIVFITIFFSSYSFNQKNYFSPNFMISLVKNNTEKAIEKTKKILSYPEKLIQSEFVQKNKPKILIGAAVFALGGYLAYRYFKSNKKNNKLIEPKIIDETNKNKTLNNIYEILKEKNVLTEEEKKILEDNEEDNEEEVMLITKISFIIVNLILKFNPSLKENIYNKNYIPQENNKEINISDSSSHEEKIIANDLIIKNIIEKITFESTNYLHNFERKGTAPIIKNLSSFINYCLFFNDLHFKKLFLSIENLLNSNKVIEKLVMIFVNYLIITNYHIEETNSLKNKIKSNKDIPLFDLILYTDKIFNNNDFHYKPIGPLTKKEITLWDDFLFKNRIMQWGRRDPIKEDNAYNADKKDNMGWVRQTTKDADYTIEVNFIQNIKLDALENQIKLNNHDTPINKVISFYNQYKNKYDKITDLKEKNNKVNEIKTSTLKLLFNK